MHCTPCFADRVVLSANSGRKYPKNAAKTHDFGILCAAGVPPVWGIFCYAYLTLRFNALLSYRLCAAIRWPLTRVQPYKEYSVRRTPMGAAAQCTPCKNVIAKPVRTLTSQSGLPPLHRGITDSHVASLLGMTGFFFPGYCGGSSVSIRAVFRRLRSIAPAAAASPDR